MSENKKRLLIVSSRSRNKIAISGSVLSNVIKLEYDYETSTLSDLVTSGLIQAKQSVGQIKALHIGSNIIRDAKFFIKLNSHNFLLIFLFLPSLNKKTSCKTS